MPVLQKYLRLILSALLVLCGTSTFSAAQTVGEWSRDFAGAGLDGFIALAAGNGCVCAAGDFNYAGGLPAEVVACNDLEHRSWTSLDVGRTVRTLGMDANGDLYIGGHEMAVGGRAANIVAFRFDTATWDELGGDLPAVVYAFAFGTVEGGSTVASDVNQYIQK